MLLFIVFGLVLQIIQADVGIVGGGLAGLSAAAELQKLGVPYTILEASSRLGGRVYPIKTEDGQWLQMGAEYINGEANDIFKMAQGMGLIDYKSDDEEWFAATSFGMGRNKLNQTALDMFVEFIDDFDEKFEKAAAKTPETAVAAFYEKEYLKFVANSSSNRDSFDGFSATYKNYLQNEWSAPLKELALANWDEWDDASDRGEEWNLKRDGFKFILDALTQQVDSKNVKINTKVSNIDWSGKKVIVTAVNATPITFDYVIVTIPLGVLKKSAKLFSPSLPAQKLDVIKYTGFGSLQKVFLEYNTTWWSENSTNLVTPYTSQNNILGDEIKIFDVVSYRKNTLLLWLSGEGPKETSRMSPKDLGSVVTSHLRTAFNNNSIPEPKTIYTYNWNADPLFAGAYSFITPQSYKASENSFKELSLPLYDQAGRPIVLFAGEHTHSTMYQTTVGAYESGKREAMRLKKIMAIGGK